MAELRKSIALPHTLVRDWFLLAKRMLWRRGLCTSGWSTLDASAGEIAFQGNANTLTKQPTVLRAVVAVGAGDEQTLVLSTEPRADFVDPPTAIAEPKRFTYAQTRVRPVWNATDAGATSLAVEQFLSDVEDVFEGAAERVRSGETSAFVVAVFFRSLDWPPGREVFGPYTMCSIGEPEPFDGTAVMLGRHVNGFTEDGVREDWHEELNVVATIIGIMSGRVVRLLRHLPEVGDETVRSLGFYPVVEDASASVLLRIWKSSPQVPLGVPGVSPAGPGCLPQDLDRILTAYEALPVHKRRILKDAVGMVQVATEYQHELPSVAITALWIALERLTDWAGIARHGVACEVCGLSRGRTQDAIVETMSETLSLTDLERAAVETILHEMRTLFRLPLVHQARLKGADFGTRGDVWAAPTAREVPAWSRVDALIRDADNFVRRLLVAILEEARDAT